MRTTLTLAALAALPALVSSTELTSSRLTKVYSVMQQLCLQSWENGTESEAILEWTYPNISVFSPTPPLPLPSGLSSSSISEIITMAQNTMSQRPATNTSAAAHNGSTLLGGGAAGDPASLGVAILLANATTNDASFAGVSYGDAASEELNYLLYDVPKSDTGAISHRPDQVQLWADFIYMVPPFLAYYGALNNNQTLLQTAYTQISLYRDALIQPSGLWQHIRYGTGTSDPGVWATGNAWAAAGIVRTLATILRSSSAGSMTSQTGDLQNWAEEILSNTQGYISSSGLLYNYINDTSSFQDSSSSMLMASAGLRLSTLNLTNSYVNMSLTLLSAASGNVNSSGYLTQVVDPESWSAQGSDSPEGQAFTILAYAAYNEWVAQGKPGNPSGSSTPLGKDSSAGVTASIGILPIIAALLWTLV